VSNYLLIHGAEEGGWYWHKVKKILEGMGHTVIAPALQEKMYANAKCEMKYLNSGHAPFFSKAEELSWILMAE
jgi:hypothetical protein